MPGDGLKIAYFTEWQPYTETGVLRKIIGQVQAWRALGAEAHIFSLTPPRKAMPALDFEAYGTVYGSIKQSSLDARPWARLGYFNKIVTAPTLMKAINAFAPNLIYYRQNGPWFPGLGAILSCAPAVLEINTDEQAEHHIWGSAFNTLYRVSQGKILSKAKGFVSVTEEIAQKYRSSGKPVAVIANSFWGKAPGTIDAPANDHPAFVFVGSRITGTASWHGVDKIPQLANLMPKSTFHIIGHDAADFGSATLPHNMKLYGELRGAAMAAVFAQCDIGVGTLALHRKAMDEACPLKVRDYLMQRLPVIIGYTETETSLNSADYILKIPNTSENVAQSIDAIVAFADKWHGKRIEADLGFMSRDYSETKRLNFFRQLASGISRQ